MCHYCARGNIYRKTFANDNCTVYYGKNVCIRGGHFAGDRNDLPHEILDVGTTNVHGSAGQPAVETLPVLYT